MPTRKIADPPPPPCRHPEHNPPSHMVFPPGTYEHECPACGAKMVFTVSPIYCGTGGIQKPTCGGGDKSWTVKPRPYKSTLVSVINDEPWS